MCEEHFDLLSQPHRDFVLLCLGDIACNLLGIFVFFSRDLARIGFGAAFHLRWASLAGVFQRLILRDTFSAGPAIGI